MGFEKLSLSLYIYIYTILYVVIMGLFAARKQQKLPIITTTEL